MRVTHGADNVDHRDFPADRGDELLEALPEAQQRSQSDEGTSETGSSIVSSPLETANSVYTSTDSDDDEEVDDDSYSTCSTEQSGMQSHPGIGCRTADSVIQCYTVVLCLQTVWVL